MKASDLLLRCLEIHGVDIMYGVPGEENADIMISLLNSSIKFVSTRHEQTAAFMADMYGRLTNKPGVCLSTLGPGATNLITGVANANMDNVPLIAIVGQASTTRLHKESHQNMDAVSMYKPVTKWATSIRDPNVIPEVIYKAYNLSRQGRPGAVMIELPENIAHVEVDAKPIPFSETIFNYGHCIEDVERALKLIKASKKPLILAGFGCVQTECDKNLARFIEKANIYATTTFMGKGSVSDRNPLSLHTVGLGMRDIALEAFSQSDLVICIGYRLVEWPPEYWNFGGDKKIIHLDIAPPEVDQKYIPEVELVGSINGILYELTNNLTEKHSKDPNIFAYLREKIDQDLALGSKDDSFPLKPQRIIHDLRSILKDKDIVISDVGAHKMWMARQYPTYHSRTCFIYNGFCSMGGAIPGAIVTKWLHPDKTVVAVCGDGGFMMSIQALLTAVQYKTPIIIIVWQDDYYGLIKWKQEMAFHTTSHVELYNPNFAALSEAFGCKAIHVTSVSELIPALEFAKSEFEQPTVIIVPVDDSENMRLTRRLGEIVSH